MRLTRSRVLIFSTAMATVLASALIGSAGPASAAAVTVLQLKFDGGTIGNTITSPLITGSAAGSVSSTVKTQGTGLATVVQGATDAAGNHVSGTAMRLPAYQLLGPTTPLAIVSIRNLGAEAMNPGTGTFTWKADFSLDDNDGTVATDGDNIFQRGLSPQTQWKLSADHHKVLCSVRPVGATGPINTPLVTIPLQTSNVSWYRGTCKRTAAGVLTLTVQQYDRAAAAWVAFGTPQTVSGAQGDLTMTSTIPVTIGGKLTNSNNFASTPDQFNGIVDNVVLTIG
jgi:hypothetical protein